LLYEKLLIGATEASMFPVELCEKKMTIVLATHNRHKIRELVPLLEGWGVKTLTLDQFPGIGELEESGATILDNALMKARQVNKLTSLPSLADDTGLEVDALDGKPGVWSSRWAGLNATYEDNVNKLLTKLESIPTEKRTARFRTVLAFVNCTHELTVEGSLEGRITRTPQGTNGFGYDPVFFVPFLQKTFAELSTEEKNRISHRGQALQKFHKLLPRIVEQTPQPLTEEHSL
jgi:XTP/dITP diphosphohydrolase